MSVAEAPLFVGLRKPRATWWLLIVASAMFPIGLFDGGGMAFGIWMTNNFDGDSSSAARGNVLLWLLAAVLVVNVVALGLGWTFYTVRRLRKAALLPALLTAGISTLLVGDLLVTLAAQ